ncbi:MAG TPA: hypothetical protein VM662_16435 [Sphingomonas sp.]|nr:hypothetical protein [Sphingomonas sp.]
MTGLGVGVDLTNAAITGNFRYGDGSSTDLDGAASSISAATPIVIAGLNGVTGTYDFSDVALTGDTSTLQTSTTMFWVQAGATGAGTRSDPGSIADAEASGANAIILIDSQAGAGLSDTITVGGDGTFALDAGQKLLSFLNGDTISLGGGAPGNMLLFGITGGAVTNPFAGSGAPVLTTVTAGAPTLQLASNTLVDGVVIANGNMGLGVAGSGALRATLRNSILSGAIGALSVESAGMNASIALENLQLSSSSGIVASFDGSIGTLAITALDGVTIAGGNGEGGGFYGQNLVFDADPMAAGIQTVSGTLQIGTSSARVGGDALGLDQATGGLALDLAIANTGGFGTYVFGGAGGFDFEATGSIDAILGGAGSSALALHDVSADITLAGINYSGTGTAVLLSDVTGVGAGGRAVDIDTLTVAAGAGYGIRLTGVSSGDFHFGVGSSISGTITAAIELASSGAATFTYAGGISGTTGALISIGGDDTTATFSGSLAATGGDGLVFANADGSYDFGSFALSGGARIAITSGSAGSFTFGDVDITGLTAGLTAVNLTGATGDVTFNTLDIASASATGTRGIDLTGNTGAGDIFVTNSSTITGVGIGVDLTNAARTGDFQYGDGEDALDVFSTINATTPIVITGLNVSGTYNFADVNLVGDTTQLSVNAYFVRAGATGVGSLADPGSIAGADASTAPYIVLLDSQVGAGAFDTITGTLSLADGQTLLSFRDVDSFNVGGGAPSNVTVHGITTGVIVNPLTGSGAPLLTSTDATSTVQLGGTNAIDGVVISNTGTGAGIYANGTAGTATIRNSTISGGGAGIDIRSGAAARVVDLQNLVLANAGNQPGALLNLNGTGGTLTLTGMSGLTIGTGGGETAGLVFNTVTFDSDISTAAIDEVDAGALILGTTGARIQGDGLSLTNVSGALTFSDLDIANSGGTGLLVANSKANDFLLTTLDGSFDTTGGTAVNLDPLTANVTASNVTASGGAYGILLDQVEGSFTVTGAVTITNASIAGIAIQDNTGQTDALDAAFNGAVNINNTTGAGLSFTNNTGATIAFTGGGLAVTTSGSSLIANGGGTLTITGSGNAIGNGAISLNGINVGSAGIDLASVSISSGGGIVLASVGSSGGAVTLGTVNLQNVTGTGIDVSGTFGAALSITDLDIGLAQSTAVALDLNGVTLGGAITVGDFDVTNSAAVGSTIAVDLRGTMGGQTIRLGDSTVGGGSSTIAGVATGVYLNAATNANVTFGDGEAGTDTGSSISAVTPINASAAPAAGSYDFRDVNFTASPGLGFGIGKTLFVDSDGATGGGNGSGADGANPMTLAAAEAALAAGDVILLVNNGLVISAAGTNANNTLNLLANNQVRGFGNGPVVLSLTVPSTIQLASSTLTITDPGTGAATLTSSAGADVITLGASGNRISGFILDGDPAGALRGVVDNGGATGTVIDFMTIRNFDAVGGYGIEITPSTNTTIDNVSFTGNTNDVLLNAAGSTITNATSSGATGTSITLNNATGTTTLSNVSITGAATGLSFTAAGGTVNAVNVDIAGASSSALVVTGGTANFNFDAASSITQSAGGLVLNITGNHSVGTLAYAGTINATSGAGMQFSNADGTYNFTGTTTLNGGNAGIDIYNGATGTFTFGAGTTLIHNADANSAFALLSSANVTFNGSITDNNGRAVEIDGHDAGTATFNGAINSSGNASNVISIVNSNGGSIVFNGEMNIASSGTVVSLADNDLGTITFNAGGNGLDIASTGGTGMLITGGGTVNVLGSSNSITATGGTLLSITNTGATTTTANLSFASVNSTGGTNGVFVQRTAGTLNGTVNIAGGAIATSTRGISINGDALNFSYGGTITATGGRSFEATGRTGGSITLSGAIEDAFNGISIANNSGGTIALSGNINAVGVGATGALTVTGNTGGSLSFSGATKRFDTGASNAVTLSGNTGATIDFTGGGLAISTSSGAGFLASGGGTVAVTGANNSVQTNTGQIVGLDSVSGGAGGINFATLASSGTVANTAISFNNFDGTSFTVSGITSIAATSGATSDGVFIGGNSAAAITFGATSITATGDDGIEVNGAGNGAVTFGSVTINNTVGHGVDIVNSDNTVSITGGSIGNVNDPTLNGVNISGGTGAINIAAAINKNSGGWLVQSNGHSVGNVTFSGNLDRDPGAGGGGIYILNSGGGTFTFSGSSKAINTADQNNAVLLSSNGGATIEFVNGGLDIDTTSSMAFSASGGGTITIAGANNTINTTGGVLLNLSDVSAGAAGITFASLASSGVSTSTAINFSNFDGTSFAVTGTTGIGGTSGATSDGIFIGGGSSATISFGATTIGATGDEGIEINGAGNGVVTFTSATINGSAGNGVEINASSNTVNINGGAIGASDDPAGRGVYIVGGTGSANIAASINKASAGAAVEVDGHQTGTVTFSGTITATNGTGLLFTNADGVYNFTGTTTLNGGDAGIDIINGSAGAFSFGDSTTITSPTGAAITVSDSTAYLNFSGDVVQANNAAALAVTNHAGGTLTFQTTGSFNVTNGTGFQFSNADGNYTISSANTLNGGDAGIDILAGSDAANGSTGSFAFITNTTITHAGAGNAFTVDSSDATVTFGGTIIDNNGFAVSINEHDGGSITFGSTSSISGSGAGALGIRVQNSNASGTITFNAVNLSTQTNAAVTLTSNTGKTINFAGGGTGLDIVTTTGAGFTATGGGTISVAGTGNTIAASGGTALTVQSTTISGTGLNFVSISANGGTNGILLSNTGTSGGLTITGDATGVVNSSGGTIQNITGDGIKLTGVTNVSFDQLNIQSTGLSGIDGTDVTNFAFTNGTISNSGISTSTAGTSNIAFNDVNTGINNLDGTVTVTGSTLTNAYNSGIQIYNESGTISNINISNNTMTASGSTATSKGSGVQVDINGSASTAAAVLAGTINNNVINDFVSGAGIQFQGGNGSLGPAVTLGTYQTTPGAGAMIQIANNDIGLTSAGTPLGTNGIAAGVTGTGQGNFSITGNEVSHFQGIGITGFGGNKANVSFVVDSNIVDATDNIANSSGIAVGSQLGGADSTHTGTVRAIISNNNVSGMEGVGILAGVTNSYNIGYFKIINNVVGSPTAAGFRSGIRVESGSSVGDATVFLEISGNTSGAVGAGMPGISLRKQGSVSGVNEFHIEGLGTAPATAAQVEAYVSAQNPGSVLGTGADGSTPSRVLSVSGDQYLNSPVPF